MFWSSRKGYKLRKDEEMEEIKYHEFEGAILLLSLTYSVLDTFFKYHVGNSEAKAITHQKMEGI